MEDPARLRAVLDAVTASGENGAAGSKPVLTILKPATLVLLAEAATRFRSFAQARSLYEEALKRPDPKQAARNDETRFFMVELLMREHKRAEALALAREIRDALPVGMKRRQATTCASILLTMGHYQEAFDTLKNGTDDNDPKGALWAGRLSAMALAHLKRSEEADAVLAGLSRQHPLPGNNVKLPSPVCAF